MSPVDPLVLARLTALEAQLRAGGYLGDAPAPIACLAFDPPATVAPTWRAGADRTAAQAVIDGWDWTRRQTRGLNAILADLLTLTSAQQAAVWSDLTSGSPPKWRLTSSDPCVWAKASQGTLSLTEKVVAVAFYVREHVAYLVNPVFDPTINVPGDAAVS